MSDYRMDLYEHVTKEALVETASKALEDLDRVVRVLALIVKSPNDELSIARANAELKRLHAMGRTSGSLVKQPERCNGNCGEIKTGPDGEPGIVYCGQCQPAQPSHCELHEEDFDEDECPQCEAEREWPDSREDR